MLHNTLYKLAKNQKNCIAICAGLLVLSTLLAVLAYFLKFQSFENTFTKIATLMGGLSTLAAVYWPFQPTYKNSRLKGRNTFDYSLNNGCFNIASDKKSFTLKFSKASGTSIYMYSDPPNIKRIALIEEAGKFSDIKDVTAADYSSGAITINEGQIIALENKYGNYALIRIDDIRDKTRLKESPENTVDEVTFSYIINPNGGINFS